VIDIQQSSGLNTLQQLAPSIVIHTGGPFQGQDYRVPQACIQAGSHYIDLADDRRFVCEIKTLDDEARKRNVLVVSGASSVPGLSSVVIDRYADQFSELESIDFAIAPGNRAERGEATVKAILSYTGHLIPVWMNRQWVDQYGWMSARRWRFGSEIGERWLANVDIPDLELFPERYSSVHSVRFQAGLELPVLHHAMVGMAWLVKAGIVPNWSRFSRPIYRMSDWFKGFGSDIGGMKVVMSGLNAERQKQKIEWLLCAKNGVGPYIPSPSPLAMWCWLIGFLPLPLLFPNGLVACC
jgi:saccharopine dehydrogenase-like NADP-dependent oxidoreductase